MCVAISRGRSENLKMFRQMVVHTALCLYIIEFVLPYCPDATFVCNATYLREYHQARQL